MTKASMRTRLMLMGRAAWLASVKWKFGMGQTALQLLTWEHKGGGPQLVQVSEPLTLRSVHDSNTCGALQQQQQVGCHVKEQREADSLQTHAC